ncbi:MAG: DUF423 domain-containing protein [Alphaproteobacteria bacterium]|nr:DUF423 domain-containing protein [Alphaproteobacteria bacterium]
MNLWLLIGAVNGFLAVAAGAFGAHALEGRIVPSMTTVFDTGAHYHLIHALATVAAALVARGAARQRANIAALLFTSGTVLFSGSLYFLALSSSFALVLLTPVGGLAFLAGWAALAFAALKYEG